MNTNQNTIPELGFMRQKDILKIFPISSTTWWRGIKSGKYPKGIKIYENVVMWKASDIHKLLEELGNAK